MRLLPLARGLDFARAELNAMATTDFQMLPIRSVRANPLQPRRRFDQDKLQELAESIKLHGVVQPVVVTREVEGYRLVVGERRWRASQLAGLKTIPALVREMTPQAVLEVALIENLQRHDLNPVEEARAFRFLIREHQLTQEDLAQRLGCSRPTVTNSMRLLNLPRSVQEDLEAGVLSAGHGRALLSLPDERARTRVWREAMDGNWSVRQLEARVRALLSDRPVQQPPGLEADWRVIQEQLAQSLGARVEIRPRGPERGRIELHYTDQGQLVHLVEALIAVTEQG